jgi:hypothetical protein
MRPVIGITRWRSQHPCTWVCLTQAVPILVLGFVFAIALARIL